LNNAVSYPRRTWYVVENHKTHERIATSHPKRYTDGGTWAMVQKVSATGKQDALSKVNGKKTMSSYEEFLAGKHLRFQNTGIEVDGDLNPVLFPWQRDIVRWSLRKGRCENWASCGLGKTFMEETWAQHVVQHTHKPCLLFEPLGVTSQIYRDAVKFGIDKQVPVKIVEKQSDVVPDGINITNYEKLHLFDASKFGSIVAGESGILKSYTGATKRALCEKFAQTPYRLGCSATPAPNDRMELGNHAEFLGIMPSNEMLARWFINQSKNVGHYVLRPFATKEFWRWICSWAVCVSKPSDLGYPDDGYNLPPLRITEHIVDRMKPEPGYMFTVGRKVSATEVHKEKRSVLQERAEKVAELVNDNDDLWVVWVDTDYEADAVMPLLSREYVEVRGSQPDKKKIEGLDAFSLGQVPVIITKPEIGGWGLHWAHCHRCTYFCGFSFERFYQSVRRLWRFGQQHPVDCHFIMTPNEESIKKVLDFKSQQHEEMQYEMSRLMKAGMLEELYEHKTLTLSNRIGTLALPSWL